MKLLLDTCTLLWWWSEPVKLSSRSLALLRDPANEIWVSAASAWETATKHRIGRYPEGAAVIAGWSERLAVDGFGELAISTSHALRAGSLPGDYCDPFDRMIAAQSLIEGLPVASPDAAITSLGAERVW
jgi:PIN domain nuclease of toxin-antitoxin system